MKIRVKYIAAGLALLLSSSVAYSASLSKVTVMGKPYYKYEVKKGDTMFGLSREFGWDINVLQKTNPGQLSSLNKNSIIYYPCEVAEPGQKDSTPSVATSDVDVRHQIKQGETLFSISRMYNVPVAELEKLNPGSNKGIKAGEWLVISAKGNGKTSYHTITKGETIFGVARANHISVESLLRANPGISESNFKAGDVIRVPEAGTGVKLDKKMVSEETFKGFNNYKVNKGDTWGSIAEKFGISQDILRNANKGTELRPKHYIGIPIVEYVSVERIVASNDPRESNTEGLGEIYREVHNMDATETHPEVRMAVVSDEPNTRKDRQFLRGVLMAVNDLKNSGTKIVLKVMDNNDGEASNASALTDFNPTIIVSTAEKQLPVWLIDYATKYSVPVVNTLDVKNNAFQNNPYMVQLITPSEYFNDEVAAWLKDKYGDYSLVFTGEEDTNDALASALKSIWNPSRVRSRSIDDLKTMPLNERGKYLLYSYPVKKTEVSQFLDVVNEAKTRTPLAEVVVVGRPNWIVFDESLESKFHSNDIIIPARFYMDKNARNNSRFAIEYRQMFDSAIPVSFPVYSALGYDVTDYFIKGLSASGGDMNGLKESTSSLQSDFSLVRPSNWSGPLNTAVYIVHFNPFDIVEKILIK